ncbi:DUF1007 domain-containing protein, partial [Sinorhizobium meliloti]
MKTQSIVMAGLATLLAPALAFAHPHI